VRHNGDKRCRRYLEEAYFMKTLFRTFMMTSVMLWAGCSFEPLEPCQPGTECPAIKLPEEGELGVYIERYGNEAPSDPKATWFSLAGRAEPKPYNLRFVIRDLRPYPSRVNVNYKIENADGDNFYIKAWGGLEGSLSVDRDVEIIGKIWPKATSNIGFQRVKITAIAAGQTVSVENFVEVYVFDNYLAPDPNSPIVMLATASERAIDEALRLTQEWESAQANSTWPQSLSPEQLDTKFREYLTQTKNQYPRTSSQSPLGTVVPAGFSDIVDRLPTGPNKLNRDERPICNENAYHCASIMAYAAIAKRWAQNFFDSWQPKGIDDERDAFRHASWNAWMALVVGMDKAKRFADAHETGSPDQPPGSIGQQMDYFNNDVGRRAGNAMRNPRNVKPPNQDVANDIKRRIKNGEMRVINRAYPTEQEPSGSFMVPSNSYSLTWPSGF
jgi:hypothetical protein